MFHFAAYLFGYLWSNEKHSHSKIMMNTENGRCSTIGNTTSLLKSDSKQPILMLESVS